MLKKKEVYTTITPIPGFIPRQLAIDILHSHSEVITLNPLVLSHKAIPAPRDAASDEFYSTWYEITERIQYIPGLGRMGSGRISFNGCFHDMPWGLQTHIYAPMGVDLRNKYRIAGNQPGVEAPELAEIGSAELGIPSDGLYLREDIEIRCNITVVGFVKAELKKASKEMVQRIIKKAELLDAGVLQGMIEDGKLKTFNPADRSSMIRSASHSGSASPQPSPTTPHYSMHNKNSPSMPYNIPRPESMQQGGLPPRPGTSGSQGPYHGHQPHQFHGQQHYQPTQGGALELPTPRMSHQQQQQQQPQQQIVMELPGDFYHPQQPSPRFTPASASAAQGSPRAESFVMAPPTPPQSHPGSYAGDARVSSVSAGGWSDVSRSDGAGTASSRPSSMQSDAGAQRGLGGARSPPPPALLPGGGGGDQSRLSTCSETAEEHNNGHREQALKRLDGGKTPSPKGYNYNPADYAKVSPQMQQTSKMAGRNSFLYSQQQTQQRYGY
ncbi:hypothetical protein GGTG_05534 [Gaeumannomyces tritici R3-111a-1]|uniref:DUF7053 domain-containing protein n=1 Tax=Gaeumannomyces tritici (strain R3-111a-1) TaxID=644352 RepID=J3NW69_GAET3|nr:hypothetical protein GGTG_05534 [Gaeumannomyces tritici R3-111a-1]EJT75601.1 hypothetical protein GGTG_05534 [Gaeumannomyces tritici R3-111a-1]